MLPDPFTLESPEATEFTPLISELFASDLKTRIRNELDPTTQPANAERVVSAHDALLAAVVDLGKAKKAMAELEAYCDAAEQYASEQLKFHSALKTYFARTTDQLALRSELVAPIRRLPNEVLQLVFLEVHAQSTEKERYNPITAQVCTFWRQLAHATPLLWTSVNVNLKADEDDGINAVAHMKTQIERAKRHMVSVRFSMKEDRFGFDFSRFYASLVPGWIPPANRHFNAAVATLLQYRDRVESLHIPRHEVDLGGYLATTCATENVTFDNLHTLSLYEDEGLPDNFDATPLLKACPNVRRMRVFHVPDTADIHWEQLKEFKGGVGPTALAAFLSRAQDVEQAEISSFVWSTVPSITFSDRLTALSLDRLSEDTANTLATAGPPSSLRYLSLAGHHTSCEILLDSWGSDLEFLALRFDITAKDLKNLLPSTPHLECLRIRGDRATPPNLFSLLPRLTHLEVYAKIDKFALQAVRKLLARPLKPTSRGKRLCLRSVAFLPTVSRYYDRSERLDDENRTWKPLYRDLEEVGIEAHEYRTRMAVDVSTFGTAFFEEHGWGV